MKKISVRNVMLVIGVVLLMTAASIPMVVAAETRWVGPNQPYTTIQDAVDDAAPGDTILVFPSTYEESVTVQKDSLKIVALGKGVVVDPPGEGEACFEVKADHVVISSFDLTGTDCAPAIRFEGSNNIFEHNQIYDLTCPGVNAIECRDEDGGSNRNVIAYNTISKADQGIVIGSDAEDAINEGNAVLFNMISECGAVGIVIKNGGGTQIEGNKISDVPFGPGISIIASNTVPQSHHKIAANVISDVAGSGIAIFADNTATLSEVLIAANKINGVGDHGVLLSVDPEAAITRSWIIANSMEGNGVSGIFLGARADYNRIIANRAVNNEDYGIAVSGNNNKIFSNVALNNATWDLFDSGTDNKWVANKYDTANWLTKKQSE